ncbi:MAG: ribosome maturation factor RimM [Sphaerochaetaceae bacterium]|nr:ribosome maturation factor RimM [Sphaerochaetaceae bacterium]MDC7248236.1 ribosome maturation factor RimM [Sphaerochaetaceae bacterium]
MKYIATGVLKSPHGLQGNIKLATYSGEIGHLLSLKKVQLRRKGISFDAEIEEIRQAGKEALIRFKGIDNPEDARKYNGYELWVEREHASSLDEDEFYVADLVGCTLVHDKVAAGTIVAIFDGPQSLLLEVEHGDPPRKSLVPFMKQYVGDVDIEKKTIELIEMELLS